MQLIHLEGGPEKTGGGGEVRQGREGGHMKCLLFSQLLLWLLGPLGASVEYFRVIPPEGHGLSRLYVTDPGGHCFGAAPGGIDIGHCWTSRYGLWSQRKPSAKTCGIFHLDAGPAL